MPHPYCTSISDTYAYAAATPENVLAHWSLTSWHCHRSAKQDGTMTREAILPGLIFWIQCYQWLPGLLQTLPNKGRQESLLAIVSLHLRAPRSATNICLVTLTVLLALHCARQTSPTKMCLGLYPLAKRNLQDAIRRGAGSCRMNSE